MANFWTEIVDVRGAFLTAEFEPNHRMFVSVPKGFEKNFPESVVLLLKKTLYGTCQAAIRFILDCFNAMKLMMFYTFSILKL
jgi:hypothetical protein